MCEERACLPALQLQGHLRGGGGHALTRVHVQPFAVSQLVWGDLRSRSDEVHMKMYRLVEVTCEFSDMGCAERFR